MFFSRCEHRLGFQSPQTNGVCETKEEMKISLCLLASYLKSTDFQNVCHKSVGESIVAFIRGHVLPHEQFFAGYLFHSVRCLDTITSSGHEGTNNAIKLGASRVNPQHTLDKSCVVFIKL